MDADDELAPQEFKTNVRCPDCGKDLYLIYYTTEIAYEEGISIETYYCKECMFKHNAITPLKKGDPMRTSLRIRSADDLRVIIYRSSEAVVQVPEIEAEVLPGDKASGEITTVEGILQRILEKVEFVGPESEDPDRMRVTRDRLSRTLSGKDTDLTIVIEDPSGKSKINSSKASREKVQPRN